MSTHEHSHNGQPQGSFLASRAGLVLLAFLAIGGFLLFSEHRAHVLGTLFYVLPFACLLMHMFMHGGHGHSGHGAHRNSDERNPS
ncbi:MAG: DUF2933 domain-containing protein [Mesorhizobium sp.]|uniref:DUF2933 domain-containing protein n=1 Tax=unclassified Mesorhizobium TaxID=325217 RepID=UPI000FCC5B28|nr:MULTISPECIES: DUF2933 domain-containing protein [unclassified Mesorhizobium]RUV67032.1 DUF2933 domain-containing protein [Mesorhizobium sp. M5C.F.Cr.IN.023.01.1.1]RWF88698.1 MAG: DUF2933 domain-containing protein [Mesorhizobium sp.]RWF92912.1 MAG: DUF2933 domain-containing protein [Mesorhizobium sp.]RWI41233.1 MAG: DUF2933 domain-containing protein [Mesorhizobium sp.]RWI49773.1 MAG: DUF2933 domain-containing protein [Mesorhizobium sp.]